MRRLLTASAFPSVNLVLSTILVEGLREFAGDLVGVAAFDLESLEHVDQFAVFQQRDRR